MLSGIAVKGIQANDMIKNNAKVWEYAKIKQYKQTKMTMVDPIYRTHNAKQPIK